jgi:hypothetical protein
MGKPKVRGASVLRALVLGGHCDVHVIFMQLQLTTQGWFMFETPEILLDTGLRDDILDLMAGIELPCDCGGVTAH